MYIAVVALTMFVMPVASVFVEHAIDPSIAIVFLVGRWFVFWSVGVRLGLAGLRQFFHPAFTARQIFHMRSDEALPLVRELGAATFATAVVGLASLAVSSFVLPVSISAAIFYGVAGFRHLAEHDRSMNESIAMVSDLFLFLVLAIFVGASTVAGWQP